MQFSRILVAVDGSDQSKQAVAVAADIAGRYDAGLTALHVMVKAGSGRVPKGLGEYERLESLHVTEADILRSAAEEILADVVRMCATADITVEQLIRTGDPAAIITEVARDVDADLVVVGSRGLSDAKGLMLGSVSHKVIAACHGAVLVVR